MTIRINYWSSSAGNNNGNAYYMYIDSGYVNPGTESLYKTNGRTVRCVAGV